ncbi:MAG: RidA family protein [Nitrospinota bacterium]
MSERRVLQPQSVAVPKPPYSPGIRRGNLVFTAGQVALDREGKVVGSDIRSQTRQALQNVEAVLKEGGASLADVVKVTVFLTDMANFSAMNEVYREFFPEDPPGRSTVLGGLARPEFLVEVEAVAALP